MHIPELDPSARAGLVLASVAVGMSTQPTLLPRSSLNQGIITGIAGLTAYAWGTSAHGVLARVGERIGAIRGDGVAARAAGNVAVVVAAGATARALAWREHESRGRAAARVAATSVSAAAAAGMAGRLLSAPPRRRWRTIGTIGTVFGLAGASYAIGRSRHVRAGAVGTEFHRDDLGRPQALDLDRSVTPLTATGIGMAAAGALLALATGESRLSALSGLAAAKVLGGEPGDYRALGRVAAAGITAGLGVGAVALVDRRLGSSGEGMEAAHADPPTVAEVTGCPESHVSWAAQSREGRRWLSMALTPSGIASVLGESQARQPIRVYAALSAAGTEEERARLLLAEVDRTRALERSCVALFSPTGSGYVNYVACETFEYLTRGDCASLAIEYSVLPSSLSLTDVDRGSRQTAMVLDGLARRIRDLPPERRPRLLMFGESLGSQVSQEVFRGRGLLGPEGMGIESAVWIGTPSATTWRRELWGERSLADPPSVGPGSAFLPRWVGDWYALTDEQRRQVRFCLFQNGDDPVPKFGTRLSWRRPDWLGPADLRPPGSPVGTTWWPITTFVATFMDLLNALSPTPGIFAEGGHDYRLELPELLRTVWRLEIDDAAMDRVQKALRRRELAWETARRWAEAGTAEQQAKVLADVGRWVGHEVTADDVQRIIDTDCQPH